MVCFIQRFLIKGVYEASLKGGLKKSEPMCHCMYI